MDRLDKAIIQCYWRDYKNDKKAIQQARTAILDFIEGMIPEKKPTNIKIANKYADWESVENFGFNRAITTMKEKVRGLR